MSYKLIFDPRVPMAPASGVLSHVSPFGVLRAPEVYVDYDDRAVLAVNLALATGRPLLLSGVPGSGKTTLARHVAERLGWEYLEEIVTSRTQARDLQWRFDALRRLRDAQAREKAVNELRTYIEPGILWWAIAPASACAASAFAGSKAAEADTASIRAVRGVVVLLDEIDKAEPDVPSDLLIPLGDNRIVVEEIAEAIPQQIRPLICITTNGERELPQALLRRCITYRLEPPNRDQLLQIATEHVSDIDLILLHRLIDLFLRLRGLAERKRLRLPSTAELIDALRACRDLKVTPSALDEVATAVLWKEPEISPKEGLTQ